MSNDAVLDQAELSVKNGDPAGAERLLSQTWPDISRAPADAQHVMAMVRMAQGRPAESVQLLRAAISAEPNALRHHIGLGHVMSEIGDHNGAIEAYTAAARIDQTWPGLLVVLSQAYYITQRFADAERVARQANAAPTSSTWEALSNALRAQGKSQEALAAAEEAVKLNRQDPNAQHAKAAALMQLNRPQDALTIFDDLTRSGLDLPVLAMNRGAALEALGRKADARAAYEDAARRWPNLPHLQDRVAAARKRV
ncbi:tetratricopeptide repeat protein [Candidatus Viadribacter manganicus]|uniref:Uncharacterized protein n=1 Tax=Candidatus Viadribacter manganicus TaxID=1759059 RepID=A0A1B1AMT9_9PROT|nr:tetratricopeptide repeat protein [Candidatus Viadribacter manganicus]ANP47845.1 hypothetical protein ATE48_19050 [Candidatus Viadribacter manganicus]